MAEPDNSRVPNEEARRERQREERVDWYLSNWVRLANNIDDDGSVIPLTLIIGGAVVTGDLVAMDAYLRGVAEEGAKTLGLKDSNAIARFKKFASAGAVDEEPRGKSSEDEPPPNYVHLRNAQIFLGGNTVIPTRGGVYWRGRLAAVDGFVLGRATKEQA